MKEYRRLLAAVRPHRGLLAAAIASMIALSAATGAFSWLVGPMFQFVFKGGALDAKALRSALPFLSAPEALPRDTVLRALPILILAIAAVRGIAYFGQFYCMGMLGQRVVADLRLALHQKLLELPPSFFARSAS
ncbi:MAG TPA: ABC transporter transmembrane domain-containing protein, partial [Myxococcales bacterium]|nr:ABC transporter transmembrane domain-containing protein [Myxococcales bacterium]